MQCKIALENGETYNFRKGQVWATPGLASHIKIARITHRKDGSIRIGYTGAGEGLQFKELDDFVLWIREEKYKPLVSSCEVLTR